VDPLYLAIPVPIFGGTHAGAVEVVGWAQWPFHLVAATILVKSALLIYRRRQEVSGQPEISWG
jgi:hypothetical protein